MRPIDADELMQKYCGACNIMDEMFCLNCKYHELRLGIKNAPAIDPEVQHGRWEEDTSRGSYSIYCSCCGSHKETICPSDYCPSCGAKMDV